MDIANLASHLIIYMVVLLLAISAHEAGHAWMSHKFGDDTAYMLGRDDDHLDCMKRAHRAHQHAGDLPRAARCAFWAGINFAVRGRASHAAGWFGRAQRLADRGARDSVEHGYLLVPAVLRLAGERDWKGVTEAAAKAERFAERHGDADLFALAAHERPRGIKIDRARRLRRRRTTPRRALEPGVLDRVERVQRQPLALVLDPGRLAQRGEAIAEGLAQSVNLGVGQFCTCPGLALGVAGAAFDRFAEQLRARFAETKAGVMLTPGIAGAYGEAVARTAAIHGIRATKGKGDGSVPALFETDAQTFLAHPELRHEIFGPSTILIRCESQAELELAALWG